MPFVSPYLVVLTCCDHAQKVVDDIVGFSKSFIAAGVPNIVAAYTEVLQ